MPYVEVGSPILGRRVQNILVAEVTAGSGCNRAGLRIEGPGIGVLIAEEGRTVIRPMRYTCRLAGKPADTEKRYTIYNARKDSLDDYWRAVYGLKHAIIVISGFYESVPEHAYQHRDLAPGRMKRTLS